MSIAGAEDIPAIDAALAHLASAAIELRQAEDALSHQSRGHITARLGLSRYHARKEIEGLRAVLLGLRRAWQAEQLQSEIAAAKGRQR